MIRGQHLASGMPFVLLRGVLSTWRPLYPSDTRGNESVTYLCFDCSACETNRRQDHKRTRTAEHRIWLLFAGLYTRCFSPPHYRCVCVCVVGVCVCFLCSTQAPDCKEPLVSQESSSSQSQAGNDAMIHWSHNRNLGR